jgi:flagella basal body P-ring formation protein FlgA
MTSFARNSTLLSLAFLAGALTAGAPATAPPDVARGVTAAIADAWGVEAPELRIEWGRLPAGAKWIESTSCRLVGRGADGWYAVVLETPGASPTSFRVRAGLLDTVWVATRPLAPGSRLVDGDLRPEILPSWGPPRTDLDTRPRAGWETRRSIVAGEPLLWPAVAPPTWIVAGKSVEIAWSRGSVRIALSGLALNSAREGESVRVRVAGRPDPLHGIAVSEGRVVLGPGRSS